MPRSIRNAIHLQNLDPGFDGADVVTLRIDLPEARYDSEEKVRLFYEGLVGHLEGASSVRGAAVTTGIPTLNRPGTTPLLVEGKKTAALEILE